MNDGISLADGLGLVKRSKSGIVMLDDTLRSSLGVKGVMNLVHRDKFGRVIDDETVQNLITNEGFNYILNAALHNQTPIADWFFAPFITSFTAAVGSTYAGGGGGGDEGETYDEAVRQPWTEGTGAAQTITNASPAVLTATVAGLAVLGIGVVGSPTGASGDDTKGDTACTDGVLLAEVASVKTLAEDETLSITYTISKT